MLVSQSLLGNFSTQDISRTPFSHIVASHVLPSELYEVLQSSFPSLETMLGGRQLDRENAAVRISSKAVLGDRHIPKEWHAFFDLHTSPRFWADIVRLFTESIRAAYPMLEEEIGRPLDAFRVGRRGDSALADVKLECQFVINTPLTTLSSVKTPHVDKRQTLFAGLFYMREASDLTEGGNLEFYTWKDKPRFLPYRMILPEDIEQVGEVPYMANTLACFINSPQAVHGVSLRAPTHMVRRYINLIAEVPFHLFKAPLISLPAAFLHWKDIKQTRRGKYG